MPDLGTIALTAGMIVAGASGAQLIHTPEAWPRNWDGFGQRIADRTGYVAVQATTFVLLERGAYEAGTSGQAITFVSYAIAAVVRPFLTGPADG